MIARRVHFAQLHDERVLCRHNDMVALGLDELPEKSFAAAVGVMIGRVNKVPSSRQEGVEDAFRLVLTGAQPQSSPKVMMPKQSSDTRRPLLPSNR